MATPNIRIANEFETITVQSTTSANANFPKENIVDLISPHKHYRTQNSPGQTEIVFNLGSTGFTDITVYMDFVNFDRFKYSRHTAATGTFVDIGGDRTIEKDPVHGVYRRVDDIDVNNNQFLKITIYDDPTTDGEAYFRIGSLAIPKNLTTLDTKTDVTFPVTFRLPRTHIIRNEYQTGRKEDANLAPSLQPMTVQFAVTTEVLYNVTGDRVREVADMLRDYTKTVFVDFNLAQSYQAYLLKYSGEFEAGMSGLTGQAEFGTLIFDVVT